MRYYRKLLSLGIFILILQYIGGHQVVFSEDAQSRNPILSFTCVNAYWPRSGSQAPSADIITSPFGIRYSSLDGYDFHEGIDIRSNFQPVHAFTDGTVDDKGQEAESGAYFVRLRHVDPCGGTFFTYYTHLNPDALYTNLEEGSNVNGNDVFVTSGSSGTQNAHLHFAGMVGGTSTLNNAINPMRDDSLPYNNSAPTDTMIAITGSGYDSLAFEIRTPKNDMDLNEIEVRAFVNGGEDDSFSMNIDTRDGIDHKGHPPGENSDEDGFVEATTEGLQIELTYDLSSINFTPDSHPVHRVNVDLDIPTEPSPVFDWGYINELRIKATDTQNTSLEHKVFIGDIRNTRTLSGIIDIAGYESSLYYPENELLITNNATVTIQSGSVFNLINDINLIVDGGATLIIESGVTCNWDADAEIHPHGTVIDNCGQHNWNELACIRVHEGGVYRNTSSNPLTIDNGALLVADGGTVELPDAGTIFESGSFWAINEGSTIKVQPNRSIIFKAGSYINAVGTAANPITFTSADGTPSRSEWGTITLYGSNNTVEYTTVEGGDWGLNFSGPSDGNVVKNCILQKNERALNAEDTELEVYDSTIEDNEYAFVLISNSDIYLDGNTVQDNNRDGIYAINSVVDVFNTTLDNNGVGESTTYHGIWASNTSDIAFGKRDFVSNSGGYNTVKNNYGAGVYRSSSSYVLVGYYVKLGTEQAGYNSIYGNGTIAGTYSGKDVYNDNIATTYSY